MTTILLQQKEGPWKRDIEKTAFYDRFQPSAGPGNKRKHGEQLCMDIFQWVSMSPDGKLLVLDSTEESL